MIILSFEDCLLMIWTTAILWDISSLILFPGDSMANTIGKSSLTAIWKPLCEGSQWEANHSHPKTAANPNDPAASGSVSYVYQKQYDLLEDH